MHICKLERILHEKQKLQEFAYLCVIWRTSSSIGVLGPAVGRLID